MKKEILTIISIFLFGIIAAQAPQSLKYQAVARNADGVAISNAAIGVKVSIKSGSINGTVEYSETFTAQSNKAGIFNINIGEGNVQTGSFSSIDWGANSYFLNMAIDVNGGSNYLDMGTSQLLSVPYSLYTGSIYVHYANDTLYIGDKYVIISGGGGPPAGTVTDYDGNVYETVTIGTQTWMKENLKSLHYADGSAIEEVYAYDDNTSNVDAYGRLYSWNAVMKATKAAPGNQGICPDGWHVPSKAECETLIEYLGGIVVAGGKMKETGYTYWDDPNDGATNESDYSGRGAGYRGQSGNYSALKQLGAIWTTDEDGDYKANRMALFHDISNAFTGNFFKTIGYSARCIKD